MEGKLTKHNTKTNRTVEIFVTIGVNDLKLSLEIK